MCSSEITIFSVALGIFIHVILTMSHKVHIKKDSHRVEDQHCYSRPSTECCPEILFRLDQLIPNLT